MLRSKLHCRKGLISIALSYEIAGNEFVLFGNTVGVGRCDRENCNLFKFVEMSPTNKSTGRLDRDQGRETKMGEGIPNAVDSTGVFRLQETAPPPRIRIGHKG